MDEIAVLQKMKKEYGSLKSKINKLPGMQHREKQQRSNPEEWLESMENGMASKINPTRDSEK